MIPNILADNSNLKGLVKEELGPYTYPAEWSFHESLNETLAF